MWRFLLCLIFISSTFAVNLVKCPQKGKPRPLPLEIRSTTCGNRCSVSKSAPVGFEVDFVIPRDTIFIFPSVNLFFKLPDQKIGEVPVEIEVKRGCDFLISKSCPLKKGDIVTWAFDWDFMPEEVFGIGVEFKAEIGLYDDDADPVTCFRINAVIDK